MKAPEAIKAQATFMMGRPEIEFILRDEKRKTS